MTYFVIAFIVLCFFGIRLRDYQNDYLSVSSTTSIKGIFIILIFLSHIRGYGVFCSSTDYGVSFLNFLGQMVVVMFFFYSGFGIAEQYRRKGFDYVRHFPVRRILKTLIRFDAAVLLFIVFQSILGNYFSLNDYLFCWIGWTSVGNSNWFIFDLLVLYTLTWGILLLSHRLELSGKMLCISLFLLTICFWLVLSLSREDQEWWMNTIIVFPLGFSYSFMKPQFDKKSIIQNIWAVIPILLWVAWRFLFGIDKFGIAAIIFALAIVGITTLITFDNKVLKWFGNYSFEIYILQRLPMLALASLGFQRYQYLYTIVVFSITILISYIFHKCLDTVLPRLIKSRNIVQS